MAARALGLSILVASITGASCGVRPLDPSPGLPQYQRLGAMAVPGATLNAVGRNLMIRRTDLSLDTRIGTHELGAVYNSATGDWRWSFDSRYDGVTLRTADGAIHDATGLAPGDAIPGTIYRVVDADSVRTKGGLVHDYDGAGRLEALHWASSDYPRLRFLSADVAGAARTIGVQQCIAHDDCIDFFQIDRDPGTGAVIAIEDRAGRRAEFAYGEAGRLVVARDGLDVERGWPGFRYEYAEGRLTALTRSEGERIEYRYDAAGRVIEIEAVDPGDPGHVWTVVEGVSMAGVRFTTVTHPAGFATRYLHDELRRVVERVDGVGSFEDRTQWAWEGLRPSRTTDPAGVETHYVHADDELMSRVEPSGNVVQLRYASPGENRSDPEASPVAEISDSLGTVETRSYDAAGRLVAVTNGAGETRQLGWGALGELTSRMDAASVITTFSDHGEHGHPTRIQEAGAETALDYDLVGNLRSGDALDGPAGPAVGGIVSRSFDADRNLETVVLAAQSDAGVPQPALPLTIAWRSDHRPVRITRPHGGDTELGYDARGLLVEQRDKASGTGHAEWQTTSFSHDEGGRRVGARRPNGMEQQWTLDAAGRITKLRNLRSGLPESEVDVTWVDGRIVSLLDTTHGAAETLSYDSAGRIVAVTHPGGERLERGYDLRSRAVEEVFRAPGGGAVIRALGYGFDAAGRPVEVCDGGDCSATGASLLERSYVDGRLETLRYGNGVVRALSYAPESGARVATAAWRGTVPIETTTIEDGVAGALRTVTSAMETFGPAAGRSETSYVLLRAEAEGGGQAGHRLHLSNGSGGLRTHAFDALGNLEGVFGSVGCAGAVEMGFNAERNRLLSVSDGCEDPGYAYDEAGFVVARGGVPVAWDAAGRIRSFGSNTSLVWDALGRPVSATLAGTQIQWRFGGRMEASASGVPTTLDLGEVKLDLLNGEHRYRHLDHRGNIAFVTDALGEVVSLSRYAGFGRTGVVGEASDRGFARGFELEGFVLLGARLYEPATGRFLAPDPVFQLINSHAYTAGNPIDFWDPSGLEATLVGELGQVFQTYGGAASLTGTIAAATGDPLGAPLAGAGAAGIVIGKALVAYDVALQSASAPPPTRTFSPGFVSFSFCSPTRAEARPVRLWLLVPLLAVQLALAVRVLRGRGLHGRGAGEPDPRSAPALRVGARSGLREDSP